jgi:uncharacterized protein
MSVQKAAIFFAESEKHGRGVFAARKIEDGEIIEICPVLLFSKAEKEHLDQTFLYDYYFDWGEDDSMYALCLGYGSLYNHDYEPNAEYTMDFGSQTIDFNALRDIQPGEEITVSYNGDPDVKEKVWFDKE